MRTLPTLSLVPALLIALALALPAANAEAQARPTYGYQLDAPLAPPSPEPFAPSGYEDGEVRTRSNIGLMIGGGVLWVASYGANIVGSGFWSLTHVFSNEVDSGAYFAFSAIPLAGPILQLQHATADFERGLLIGNSVLQLTGLTLLLIGALTRNPIEPRVALGGGADLSVLPSASADGAGLSVAITH